MEKENHTTKHSDIAEKIGKIMKDTDYEVGDAYCPDDVIRPLVAINCSEFLVAHSKHGLRPVRQFSEVFLLPHILETMQKLGLNRLQRLQSYTWPHLSSGSGHGAMIVSAPRSGRTFSYIPPLCDAVCRALTAGRRLRGSAEWCPDQEGALAVILVPDAERVRQVRALCYALLRKALNEEWFTLTLTIVASMKAELYQRLLNGVGCLVATPAQLWWLQQEAPGLLRFPRLQFVVYDDVDLMPPDHIQKAEQALHELLPRNLNPQLVLVSQSYDRRLMDKLTAENCRPALVFGDLLEAAVYGGTRIRIALCPSERKVDEVIQVLHQRRPKHYRTVVYCSDDQEMRRLVTALEGSYHACLPYYQTAGMEVREQVDRWMDKTQGVILLCTDDCPELIIRHSHTLIHYGMSSSWGKFKMRHLAISGNLTNRLASAEPNTETVPLHSLVLLDDNNQNHLPRLVDFLRQHQEVDAAVVELVTKMRQEMEKERGNHNAVCRHTMMMGECIDPSCDERHHLTDFDQHNGSVPASGDVKVQLVRVYSPTHFCVHLVEHLPPQGTWQPLPNMATQHMRIQLLQNAKPRRYWPPVAGVICMYHSKTVKERVRVLQVPPIKVANLVSLDLEVLVQAIDEDTRIFTAKSGRLYECPEELQQLPPMAIDLRLLGLVPFTGEREWGEDDRRGIDHKLAHLPKDHFLQANIQFATARTLFVRNLVAITYAPILKTYIWHLSLCHFLMEGKLVKRCEEAEKKVLAFFKAGKEVDVQQKLKENKCQEVENKKEYQKENEPPNKTTSSLSNGRGKGLAKVALKEATENQLEQKQSEHKVESSPEPPKSLSKEDRVAQLYECFMKHSLLHLEEAQQSEKDSSGPAAPNPTEFLDLVISGGGAAKAPVKPKKKKPKAIIAAPEPPRTKSGNKLQVQLPPNVVRPTTTYYQTLTTLELQVLLPNEVGMYAAVLEEGQIFFWATCQSSKDNYQFVLNLQFPYSSLNHRMRGRTVYISVQKTLAAVDPLPFNAYPFMKPNHEMFAKLEDQQMVEVTKIRENQKEHGGVQSRVETQDDEDSYDEEKITEGVELPGHQNICED